MSTYTFAAVEARTLVGHMIPMDAAQAGEGKLAFTLRRPIGVVGAISPFNFPCNLVAHKIAPALAAGCPVVLKPASATPLSALLLAELEHEAGLPEGWLTVLVGPAAEIGDVLVEDERVRHDHVHRLERGRLEAPGARAAQARQARARELDAGHRRGRRGRRDGGDEARSERVRVRGPELHLRPAHLRRASGARRVPRRVRAEGRGAEGRRPGRRRHRRRAGDRRGLARAHPLVDRRGRRRRAHRRRAGWTDQADGDRERLRRREGELPGGLRPCRASSTRSTPSTRGSTARTERATACRPASSPPRSKRRSALPSGSTSAA